MDLRQLDWQARIDLDPPHEEWYYWTQCWFYDLDNQPASHPSVYFISIAFGAGTLYTVTPASYRISWPPYSGDNSAITALFPEHGDLLVPDGKFIPHTGVRLSFYSGENLVGYKRWQVPLRPMDLEGDQLSIGLWSQFVGEVRENLLLARICSYRGDVIDRIEVDRRAHLWQKRHGTKRSTRPVIALS